MIADIDLDHVAVAAERLDATWPRYAGDLAGRYVSGGTSSGFRACQFAFAGGMRLEVLEPHAVERNDFLRRFLDHTGPAPHHLTFKVADIRAAIAEAEAAGVPPVSVDLSDPRWQEAFLHPKQARGVVVQLAQAADEHTSPPAPGLPPARVDQPARLDHVAHAVASIDDALELFGGLLAGRAEAEGDGDGHRWVQLAWPGPGRVRLLTPAGPDSPLHAWLAGRPGRVHHLAFTVEDPDAVDGSVAVGDGVWEVPPSGNLGVRLVLRPA